jgi:hypothetical protein
LVEEVAHHDGLAQKPFKGHVDIVVQLMERGGSISIAEFLVSPFMIGYLLGREHLAFFLAQA